MARCKICRDKFEPKYFLQKACIKPKCLAEWARLERELKADKFMQSKGNLLDCLIPIINMI
jgi:hypothetical protein